MFIEALAGPTPRSSAPPRSRRCSTTSLISDLRSFRLRPSAIGEPLSRRIGCNLFRSLEAYGAKLVADAPIPYWAVPRAKKSPPRKVPVHPLLIGKEPRKFTVRPEQLRRHFIERHKPFTAYQCRHSWKDEAVKAGTPMEMRMQLMGHSRRRAIGDQGVYGSSGVDLEEGARGIKAMWTEAA
jgi:hypothetical protein